MKFRNIDEYNDNDIINEACKYKGELLDLKCKTWEYNHFQLRKSTT